MMTSFDYIDIAWGCSIVGGNRAHIFAYTIEGNNHPFLMPPSLYFQKDSLSKRARRLQRVLLLYFGELCSV